MARPVRNAKQKDKDRAEIARLYVQGYSYRKISEMLNAKNLKEEQGYTLTYAQIAYDVRLILDEWQEQRISLIDKYIDRELAKLDAVEHEMWKAWKNSTLKSVTTKKRTDRGVTIEEVIEQGQTGDPRYMVVILQCIDKRKELIGYTIGMPKAADPSTGTDQSDKGANSDYATDDELLKERERIYANMQKAMGMKIA